MVQVSGLSRSFGDLKAVDNITFSIAENEAVALIGENGAGKTTTLRMLTGYLVPDSGSIKIAGSDSIENPYLVRAKTGYLPENPSLYKEMSVENFLLFMYRLRTGTRENGMAAVNRVIDRLSLELRRHEIIGTLSAGYLKRVALAQAIVHDPALLILDEPVSDLDPAQIREIRNMINELKSEMTVLISSHILTEIEKTADRIIVMKKGRIIDEKGGNEKITTPESEMLRITVACEQSKLHDLLKRSGFDNFQISDEGGQVTAMVPSDREKKKQLLKLFTGEDIELISITESGDRLEDYFFRVTGHE